MIRTLHVLDHSIPLHSGYTFRTAALLREQRALGWETFHLTSPKQGEISAPLKMSMACALPHSTGHRRPCQAPWAKS
jgi:hypothetical protein